jgi:hypothetical protein
MGIACLIVPPRRETTMLPIGKGQGEVWKEDKFICHCDYDISAPLPFASAAGTQRIRMEVHDYDCEELLDVPGLTLVLADGSRHRLPRPLNFVTGDGYLECYLSTDLPID